MYSFLAVFYVRLLVTASCAGFPCDSDFSRVAAPFGRFGSVRVLPGRIPRTLKEAQRRLSDDRRARAFAPSRFIIVDPGKALCRRCCVALQN